MGSQEQTRRQFCANTCRAASVAALGGAVATILESCGASNPASAGGFASALPTVSGSLSGSTIQVSVSGGALAATGALALVTTSGGDVLVARTGPETFVALSAGCTHQACEITGFSGQTFVCPCHGSEFDTNGHVVRGPAAASLRQFPTQLAGDILTITA